MQSCARSTPLISHRARTGGAAGVADDGDVFGLGSLQRSRIGLAESHHFGERVEEDSERAGLGFESRQLGNRGGAGQHHVAQGRGFVASA